MKEVIENIFNNDIPLKEIENQAKQEIINKLLNALKEKESNNEAR